MGQRAAKVVFHQVHERRCSWGKFTDAQVAVQKDRAQVGTAEQVVDIRIQCTQLLDLALILGIHRDQLFIDRLQLFVRTLQLLVCRHHFLVGRLKFFVAGF